MEGTTEGFETEAVAGWLAVFTQKTIATAASPAAATHITARI
jgi:hypothetical protein